VTVYLGSNSHYLDILKAAGIAATARRVYRDDGTLPQFWPGTQAGTDNWWPGQHVIYSLRPSPDDVLAGHLDVQIKALVAQAPPGSFLTIWHEAGTLDYPGLVDWKLRQAHVHMHELCKGSPVAYGVIICGPPAEKFAWVPMPDYPMDWYGVDIYDGPHYRLEDGSLCLTKLYGRLDEFLAMARERSGQRWPVLTVPETNSSVQARRPEWFTAVTDWVRGHNGRHVCTFWNPTGPLSGDWVPGDTATIDALITLAADLAAPQAS
jgi:hypothetical protein